MTKPIYAKGAILRTIRHRTRSVGIAAPLGSTCRVLEDHHGGDEYVKVEWIDRGKTAQKDGHYFPDYFELASQGPIKQVEPVEIDVFDILKGLAG